MRFVFISDTHQRHEELEMPKGDILVHSGDFCSHGTMTELIRFARWMAEQPYRHKIVVAGNHDRALENDLQSVARYHLENAGITYLQDSGCRVDGKNIWGSPWQPTFHNWAFNLPRGKKLKNKWDLIPKETDILVTHGPPKGVLDSVRDEHVGCEELWRTVNELKPRLHVFGHIHEGAGFFQGDCTMFLNASSLCEKYREIRKPIVLDL